MSMREQQITSKPRGRRRAVLVTVVVSLMVSMALPLTGYLAYETGLMQTAQAQDSDEEAVNPRAEYWRAVRKGTQGYSAVTGQEADVLIQNGGQNWRAVRNGPISFYGGSLIIVVLLVLIALTIRSFRVVSRPAAWLMVPYLLWVLFASLLNLRIVQLN